MSATYGRRRCAKRLVPRGDVLQLEGLVLVDAHEPDVLLGECGLDLLAQDLRVEQVLDANPDPRRLVGIRGADPAPRRPDLELAEPLLARAVDRDVPRHDQVRVARDLERVGADPAAFEIVDLAEQHLRVDDAAGAEDADLAGENPGGKLAELERLAGDDHRVAGVRPTLVAADDVRLLREQVDDLALAFVAPLRTDDDGGRHDGECARSRPRARRWGGGSRARRGSRDPART